MLVLIEYAELGSLQQFLQTHELNSDQRLRFAISCSEGLAHVHQKGFLHRDVAARNVLLTSDFTCKLAGKFVVLFSWPWPHPHGCRLWARARRRGRD